MNTAEITFRGAQHAVDYSIHREDTDASMGRTVDWHFPGLTSREHRALGITYNESCDIAAQILEQHDGGGGFSYGTFYAENEYDRT